MELFDKKFLYLEWDDKLEGKEVFIGDTLPQLRVSVNEHCDSPQGVSRNVCDDTYYPFMSSSGMQYSMAYYDPNYECKRAYAEGKTIQCKLKDSPFRWEDCIDEPKWLDTSEYRVKPEPEMWTACIDDEGIISSMPACEWNKNKGRQLIEGTREKCEIFAIDNYCNKCAYHAACIGQKCIMNLDMWHCQGFRELKAVKKRRWTNRELAKWIWQGNGQVKNRDGYYTLIACTAYDIRDDNKPCPDYYVVRGWDETEWHEPEVEE